MNEVKSVWTNQARLPYGQSEIFRFYNGPIDFEEVNDGLTDYLESIGFVGVEGLLNAWPLDEAYIDYVEGDLSAGVINDRSIKISKEQIELLNERDGEKNISTGFHAIEFLLWGQDTSLVGPGQRPVNDYTTAKNADRRRAYLNTLVTTLVDHLTDVSGQWVPGMVNYRHYFTLKSTEEVLTNLFVSMTSMAGDELKSERIENALLLEDQEEEHSCFSDTTVNDIFTNYKGVKNIYMGEYLSFNTLNAVSGPSVRDLVIAKNAALNTEIESAFTLVEETIAPFYNTEARNLLVVDAMKIELSFDVAITTKQEMVQEIIDALDHLDTLLKQAASELGVSL